MLASEPRCAGRSGRELGDAAHELGAAAARGGEAARRARARVPPVRPAPTPSRMFAGLPPVSSASGRVRPRGAANDEAGAAARLTSSRRRRRLIVPPSEDLQRRRAVLEEEDDLHGELAQELVRRARPDVDRRRLTAAAICRRSFGASSVDAAGRAAGLRQQAVEVGEQRRDVRACRRCGSCRRRRRARCPALRGALIQRSGSKSGDCQAVARPRSEPRAACRRARRRPRTSRRRASRTPACRSTARCRCRRFSASVATKSTSKRVSSPARGALKGPSSVSLTGPPTASRPSGSSWKLSASRPSSICDALLRNVCCQDLGRRLLGLSRRRRRRRAARRPARGTRGASRRRRRQRIMVGGIPCKGNCSPRRRVQPSIGPVRWTSLPGLAPALLLALVLAPSAAASPLLTLRSDGTHVRPRGPLPAARRRRAGRRARGAARVRARASAPRGGAEAHRARRARADARRRRDRPGDARRQARDLRRRDRAARQAHAARARRRWARSSATSRTSRPPAG